MHVIIVIFSQALMKVLRFSLVLIVMLSAAICSEIKSSQSLAVTIYNDQFAMVKDVRKIAFDQGRSDLYFTEVSTNILTETVTFKALQNSDSVNVYEQNYEANLITPSAILQKYIGKEVEVFIKLGNKGASLFGTLLTSSGDYILKTQNGIEVLNNVEAVRLKSVPQGFFTKPTLNWKVFSKENLTTDCEVAYRTFGLSWKADYSLTLNPKEDKADLGGWVSIDNRSGKRYHNAKLKLIAGDVNTVGDAPMPPESFLETEQQDEQVMGVGAAAPEFTEKSFSDFHMYTLSEPTSLNDNSEKQVEFIPKVYGMAIRKYNQISISSGHYSQTNLKASVKIEFLNSQSNKLGMAFPKGIVRVFKEDEADGSLQFLGEDSIDHTPKDEKISINTGNAFDISSDKRVINYKSYDRGGYSADLNLTIVNHKQVPTEVEVKYSNYYGDNMSVKWQSEGVEVEKVSVEQWKITRQLSPNERYSYLWHEDYRP